MMQQKLRTGPYPLSMHLGMTVSSWPVFSDVKDIDMLREMAQGIDQMLQGVRLYQKHSYRAEQEDLLVVWQKGTVEVRGAGGAQDGPVLLLVPSLINRSSILDLSAERSLTRWLARQGVQTYLFDWGEVIKDPEQDTIDGLIEERLLPAIDHLCIEHEGPISALGYCMGGTILLRAAAQQPDKFKRLIMLAAPWDFHAGSGDLLSRVHYWAPSVMPYIVQNKPVPVEGIQTLFASLDPAMAARKFIKFTTMDPESKEAKLFVAVEDWLNDGVALPAKIAQECIQEWFFANRPGQSIDLTSLKMPTLIITSQKDKLVEYESAAALKTHLPQAEILDPDCGHIGMIAGGQSIEKMWQPLKDWILQTK